MGEQFVKTIYVNRKANSTILISKGEVIKTKHLEEDEKKAQELAPFEKGKMKRVKNVKQEIKIARSAAEGYLRKHAKINIKFSSVGVVECGDGGPIAARFG